MIFLVKVTEVHSCRDSLHYDTDLLSLLRLEFPNGNHYRKGESFCLVGLFNQERSHSEYFGASWQELILLLLIILLC